MILQLWTYVASQRYEYAANFPIQFYSPESQLSEYIFKNSRSRLFFEISRFGCFFQLIFWEIEIPKIVEKWRFIAQNAPNFLVSSFKWVLSSFHALFVSMHHHCVRTSRFCGNFQTCNSAFDCIYEKWIYRAKEAPNTRLCIRVGGKHLLDTISNFSAKFGSFGVILGWFWKTAPQGGGHRKIRKMCENEWKRWMSIFEKNSKKFRLSAFLSYNGCLCKRE